MLKITCTCHHNNMQSSTAGCQNCTLGGGGGVYVPDKSIILILLDSNRQICKPTLYSQYSNISFWRHGLHHCDNWIKDERQLIYSDLSLQHPSWAECSWQTLRAVDFVLHSRYSVAKFFAYATHINPCFLNVSDTLSRYWCISCLSGTAPNNADGQRKRGSPPKKFSQRQPSTSAPAGVRNKSAGSRATRWALYNKKHIDRLQQVKLILSS